MPNVDPSIILLRLVSAGAAPGASMHVIVHQGAEEPALVPVPRLSSARPATEDALRVAQFQHARIPQRRQLRLDLDVGGTAYQHVRRRGGGGGGGGIDDGHIDDACSDALAGALVGQEGVRAQLERGGDFAVELVWLHAESGGVKAHHLQLVCVSHKVLRGEGRGEEEEGRRETEGGGGQRHRGR